MLNLFTILARLTYPIKRKIAWMSQRNPIPLSSLSILFFFIFPSCFAITAPLPHPSSFMSCHCHQMCLAVIALLCMWCCQTPVARKQNWDNGIITVCTCINWGGKNKAESNVRGKKRIRLKKKKSAACCREDDSYTLKPTGCRPCQWGFILLHHCSNGLSNEPSNELSLNKITGAGDIKVHCNADNEQQAWMCWVSSLYCLNKMWTVYTCAFTLKCN